MACRPEPAPGHCTSADALGLQGGVENEEKQKMFDYFSKCFGKKNAVKWDATKFPHVGRGDSDTGNRSPWSWEPGTPKNHQKSMSKFRLRGNPWAPPPHSYPRGGVYCWIAPTLRDHAISHRVARSVSKRILDFRNNLSPWLREFTR